MLSGQNLEAESSSDAKDKPSACANAKRAVSRENNVLNFSRIRMIPVGLVITVFVMIEPGWAQVRGVYPPGIDRHKFRRHS